MDDQPPPSRLRWTAEASGEGGREHELVPERVAIAYRALFGDEARDLSVEDVAAIRRHAQAMAHSLIDAFREMHSPVRG